MLSRIFDRRCRGYEAVGYTIQLPGSAVPGWPAEVPLPVDPLWKSQYAASARRLVRDGVDPSLANLFVHIAKAPDLNREGAERARSSTEAFLYRRLETFSWPRQLSLFAPISACIFSCNDHVTEDISCGFLEVLQHHLRPLSCCKAMKGGAFHGGNTGSNPVGDAKNSET